MIENPFVKRKRESVEVVRKLIEDEGEIPQSRIIGVMGVYGLKEKTVIEYLRNLQDAGFIVYDTDGKVWKIRKSEEA